MCAEPSGDDNHPPTVPVSPVGVGSGGNRAFVLSTAFPYAPEIEYLRNTESLRLADVSSLPLASVPDHPT